MRNKKQRIRNGANRHSRPKRPPWELRLYVADTNPRSLLAQKNLEQLCKQLGEPYRVTIIDIVRKPEKAQQHNILATPTLVRLFPGPEKRLVGTLTNTDQVLQMLEANGEVGRGSAFSLGIGPMGHA